MSTTQSESGLIPKNREEIIADIRRTFNEIQSMFDTAKYWNQNVRKPDEKLLTAEDVDPDGVLREHGARFAAILNAEDQRAIGPDPLALRPAFQKQTQPPC